MFTGFPTNTVILIVVAMIGIAAGSWFSLSQALRRISSTQPIKRIWHWGIAILLITWFLIRLILTATAPDGVVLGTPFIVTFLGLGLLAGVLPLLISPVFRQMVRAVPETWLVGIHTIRIGGFLFLALLDMNLLPAEFALPAGYGDVTVGLLAPVMVYLLATRNPHARRFLMGWHAVGLLDLIVALITGTTYIAPFATQLAASGTSLHYLNYVLIVPSFGVPLLALLHIYSLFQMFSSPAERTQQKFQASFRAAEERSTR